MIQHTKKHQITDKTFGQRISGFGNPYLFTARRFDEKAGVYYYRNRYYEPRHGRFVSRDPLVYEDGFNLYPYVLNSPVSLIDPKGLKKWNCEEGPEISAPETILTYVDNLTNAKGRTAVIYNVFVCCLCKDKTWKIKIFLDVHYWIKIEKRYRATRLGPFIYGHELQHVASIKQAINNSAQLRNEIKRQTDKNYGYLKGCEDNLIRVQSLVLAALLNAIKTGAGHDTDPNTTKPAEGEEIDPGGPVPPPADSKELNEIKQKLKGYKTYAPK